jgi:hypothetical protein
MWGENATVQDGATGLIGDIAPTDLLPVAQRHLLLAIDLPSVVYFLGPGVGRLPGLFCRLESAASLSPAQLDGTHRGNPLLRVQFAQHAVDIWSPGQPLPSAGDFGLYFQRKVLSGLFAAGTVIRSQGGFASFTVLPEYLFYPYSRVSNCIGDALLTRPGLKIAHDFHPDIKRD